MCDYNPRPEKSKNIFPAAQNLCDKIPRMSESSPQHRRLPALVVLFALGLAASTAQLVLVREFLVVFAGHELTLGVIYAGWFLGIFAGAALAPLLVRRYHLAITYLVGAIFCLVTFPPAAVAGVRSLREFFSVDPGRLPGLIHLAISSLMYILPAGAFTGLAFPLACRAGAADGEASMPGQAYVWESAGSIAGGVLVSLVLAGRLPSLAILGLAGGILVLAAAVFLYTAKKTVLACFFLLLGFVALSGLATNLWASWDQRLAEKRFFTLATGTERVAWRETPYHFLDLAKNAEQYSLYGDGKLLAVFPDPYQSTLRANLILAQHPQPKRILILGTASFGLLPPMLRHPLQKIDLVELDPGTIELVEQTGVGVLNVDDRVALHHTDGRRFLRETTENWDIIFSDAPDPLTVATGRFYTLEFFRLARSRLAPAGVFITRLSSSPGTLGESSLGWLAVIERTLRRVFARVLVLPGEEAFLLASDADVLLDQPEALAERFAGREVSDPLFTPYHFRVLVQKSMVEDLARQLDTVESPGLSTDRQPAAYLLGLRRWLSLEGERGSTAASGLFWQPGLWWGLLLVLAVALVAVYTFSPPGTVRRRRLTLVCMLVVGGAGMALELVLLGAWQSWLGSLYRELGLMMAAFMAGIVAGGALAGSILAGRRVAATLGGAVLALGLFSLMLPILLDAASGWEMSGQKALLIFCCLLAGVATGVVFPLAGRLQVEDRMVQSRAAAHLEASDHLGAAAGAFFTGLFLLPLLGRGQTCLLLSAVCLLAAGAFFATTRGGGK